MGPNKWNVPGTVAACRNIRVQSVDKIDNTADLCADKQMDELPQFTIMNKHHTHTRTQTHKLIDQPQGQTHIHTNTGIIFCRVTFPGVPPLNKELKGCKRFCSLKKLNLAWPHRFSSMFSFAFQHMSIRVHPILTIRSPIESWKCGLSIGHRTINFGLMRENFQVISKTNIIIVICVFFWKVPTPFRTDKGRWFSNDKISGPWKTKFKFLIMFYPISMIR